MWLASYPGNTRITNSEEKNVCLIFGVFKSTYTKQVFNICNHMRFGEVEFFLVFLKGLLLFWRRYPNASCLFSCYLPPSRFPCDSWNSVSFSSPSQITLSRGNYFVSQTNIFFSSGSSVVLPFIWPHFLLHFHFRELLVY